MRLLCAPVLLALAASLESAVLLAQDSTLQFEVASVRESGRGGRGGQVPNSPDRLTYERIVSDAADGCLRRPAQSDQGRAGLGDERFLRTDTGWEEPR